MNRIVFYNAFAYNAITCQFDLWRGTATPETIKKHGLGADLSYPLYGNEKQCVDGWGYKAPLV